MKVHAFFIGVRAPPKKRITMRIPVAASAGDVCCSGARHFYVLAVDGVRALCVPVILHRTEIHRADVPVLTGPCENSAARVGLMVIRCTGECWRDNRWDSRILRPAPAIMRKILACLGRDRQARAIEATPSGLYRSTLLHGPKLGGCGRRRGGPPSD